MENLLSNTIYNYNQVYDTLRTVKLNDYLLDKRDKVHNSLFNAALDKLIMSVNYALKFLYDKIIKGEYNPDDFNSNLPFKMCDSVIKICEAIISNYIYFPNKNSEDGIEIDDKNKQLLNFDKSHYQFIEYKDKNWLNPSSILVIYTSNLIQSGNKGSYKRLTIGPISLTEFWNADYIRYNSLDEIVAENTPKYVIETVDYVNGTCKLFDKINMRFLTVNLDKIKNLNNFEFDGIIDNYNEMFHVKRNRNII